MKCIVVSDTHRDTNYLRNALNTHKDAEVLFFLGDGISDLESIDFCDRNIAVIAVKGNCDFRAAYNGIPLKKTEIIEIMGKKILVTHGDLCSVKSGFAEIEKAAEDLGADIVLFGHTHVKTERYVNVETKYADNPNYKDKLPSMKNYYLFNPGAASGHNGSYGILTLEKNAILFS